MMISSYISKAFTMAPHLVVKKAANKVRRLVSEAIMRRRDEKISSYVNDFPVCQIHSYFPGLSVEHLLPYAETISIVTKYYLGHRFDLLGSGWVNVKHGMQCLGLEGYRYDSGRPIDADSEGQWLEGRINSANLEESKRIWQLIFSEGSYCKADGPKNQMYCPIDWHLDFKSGYRWKEFTWHRDVRYGHKPGVDIKLPWELARMQHLPMLAWAYALAKDGADGFCPPDKYATEYRNQILDFIANNPPRFGVNWCCTMDVGIRIVNWLFAYDLFRGFGVTFDQEFEMILARSTYEHGKHCIANLEYSPELRNNHYLSDIAGLLFTAAYLESSTETDCWLSFAMQELLSEMEYQFHPDGSNFEASTNYHCLSTEIMLHCAILCLLLPIEKRQVLKCYNRKRYKFIPPLKPYSQQRFNLDSPAVFPDWFWGRLEKAVDFTMDITKPNNEIPQFGDNDSGRFLKLWPEFRMMQTHEAIHEYRNLCDYDRLASDAIYPDESILNHSHLLGVAGVVFKRNDFCSASKTTPETELIMTVLGRQRVNSYRKSGVNEWTCVEGKCISGDRRLEMWLEELQGSIGEPVITEFVAARNGASLTKDLRTFAYTDFGLYLYRSPRCYLAVRCGSIGQKGNGGHAHNDQLGIELTIDDQDLVRNPGTYVYTPLPDRRNQFRSTKAHFVPQWKDQEQNLFLQGQEGLFSLEGKKPAECLYFKKEGFVGRHVGFGHAVYRVILVREFNVSIWDFGTDTPYRHVGFYSNGYGRWLGNNAF